MNIEGFFQNLALVEFHIKWIRILWGPGVFYLVFIGNSITYSTVAGCCCHCNSPDLCLNSYQCSGPGLAPHYVLHTTTTLLLLTKNFNNLQNDYVHPLSQTKKELENLKTLFAYKSVSKTLLSFQGQVNSIYEQSYISQVL